MDGTDLHRFPCPNCGSDFRFDPGRGGLICDHCGNEDTIAEKGGPWGQASAITEQDYKAALDTALDGEDYAQTRILPCGSCGAQIEVDDTVQGMACPFCASPLVAAAGFSRQIKPRAVLPFALAEPTARKAMGDWLGRLWFAPSGLQAFARKGRAMDGVYVPYWTFDAQTRSRYTGQRGTVYYQTRRVMRNGRSHSEQVAKVRWRGVAGQVARFFDDVLVLGSAALPKGFTDALPPWDLTQLRPYAPEYLAGLRAEAYSIDLEPAFVEARQIMDRQIQRDVLFDIGGDRQRISRLDTQVSGVTFKHILLPIWIAAYKYNGKSYRIVINGQTGRVQGERPWSLWKIAFAVALGLAAAALVGYFAAQS